MIEGKYVFLLSNSYIFLFIVTKLLFEVSSMFRLYPEKDVSISWEMISSGTIGNCLYNGFDWQYG